MSRARWPWLALLALLAAGLVVAATDDGAPPTPEERVRSIAESVACPVCDGQSVADSSAPTAQAIRTDIARRLEAGQSPDQIRDYLSGRFGEEVLLTPPRTGVSGLIWFLPVALLVGALGGLVAAFRYWRAGDDLEVADDDRALVAAALTDPVHAGPVADDTGPEGHPGRPAAEGSGDEAEGPDVGRAPTDTDAPQPGSDRRDD